MCVVTEETERVIGERRMEMQRALSAALIGVRTRQDVIDAFEAAIATNPRDFPFGFVRFLDGDCADAATDVAWPLGRLERRPEGFAVALADLMPDPPKGAWTIPPTHALVLPIARSGGTAPVGALILGLNPHRRDGAEVMGFAHLLAGQLSGAVATADAHLVEAAETEKLRQLFEQSPSFTAVLRGPEHRFDLVNPGYLKLIGHRDVIGRSVREALPDIDGQGFYELLDEVYATGEPFRGSSMRVAFQPEPGGAMDTRSVDFVFQPIRNETGSVTGIFVEGIDVTDAHDAALALRKSEAEFRTLSEAMLNHVWTARPDGGLDWLNGRVYEYSGADHTQVADATWAAMVHPDDRAEIETAWRACLDSGEPYEAELRLRRSDGAYRWHITRAVALRGDDGAVSRWIGTNTDIDEQKAAAKALADINVTLEEQVSARTSELMAAEEALRQSQKMEAVGQLTGGLAHDFNNLLAGISGSLEMVKTRIAQGRVGETDRYLIAAQGASKRAAALTHRLLAFSRRQTLSPKPTDVNRLATEMEELIRRTVGPQIAVEMVAKAGLWSTLVDPNQLENALLNLCINARDAMPDGGKLTIETANRWLDARAARERDLAPGQYVSMCVSDNGTGMTHDVIAKAFDPFFTTKPIGVGTGLGLSMIYGFARQSGGQVRIYSEVGDGTMVCIYLPRHHLAEETEKEIAMPDVAKAERGETVLVIDDEPLVRMLIVDVLEDLGYVALEAGDGPQGMAVIRSDARIDLLITDVGLPNGMNGRQVADAAREVRPGLKVLFVTGYAENAVLSHGHLSPGMQVVTKPFDMNEMARRIEAMIKDA